MNLLQQSRGVFLAYAAIFALAIFGVYELWSFRVAATLRLTSESLESISTAIDATTRSAADHVAILRVEAERALLHPIPEQLHPLRRALTAIPDANRYALTHLPAEVSPELGTYLTGGGNLATLSREVQQEIEAALHLTPLFHRVKQNIPQAAWVYYTSANRFVSVYPLEGQWDQFHWSDEMLKHPVFADTAPPSNPRKVERWSKVYVDEAGKGLMASVTAPVSDQAGRFRGMVAIDLTLDTLSSYLPNRGLDIGRTFIANDHGQLLADSTTSEPAPTTVRQVNDTLPRELINRVPKRAVATSGEYRRYGDWLLYSVGLRSAPWTVNHVINRADLGWNVLAHMHVELVGLFLALCSMVLFEQRRRASHRLHLFGAAVDASTSAILITDGDGRIEYANRSFGELTGYALREMRGKTPNALKSGQTSDAVFTQLWDTIDRGEGWQGELLNHRRNGDPYWSELRISPIHAPGAEPNHFVCLMNDVTERKRAEQALIDSEAYNKTLFERSYVAQAILDPETRRFVDCNDAAAAIYGFASRAEVVGRYPLELSTPRQADDQPSAEYARQRLAECMTNGPTMFEWRLRRPNGEIWDAEIRCMKFRHRERTLIQFSLQDITERKRIQTQMSKAMTVFNASSQGIMMTDASGVINSVNPAFTTITGYSAEEAVGRNPSLLSSGRHDAAYFEKMWAALAATGHWEAEIWNRRKNGEIFPQWQSISAVYDEQGTVVAYISLFSDITQRKQQEEAIWRQANYDSLTGLANRSLLRDRLDQALTHARRTQTRVGVLFLDLDGFKWINDTLGHDVGDELLVEVARRLCTCVREQDTVARLGGDEFTIVVEDLGEAGYLHAIGEKVVNILRDPFALGGIQHRMSGSVGITVFPDDGETVQTLFRNADIAMYKSKQAGKNRLQFYGSDMQTDALARMQLEASLRVALEQNAFTLQYQPIVEATSGELVGGEALLRWDHPERGPISPREFIPVAEDCGLIIGIGEWALREAARQLWRWRELGHRGLRLSVNMSGLQFRDAGLPQMISRVLADFDIEREALFVEITESVLIGGSDAVEARMRAIKAMGIRYALDDFGTGFSSLSYLKRFPVDIVKIDRSFIHDCPDDRNNAHLVAAIINMARSLGVRVTAEGVETPAQVRFLRSLGCNFLQGYLISKPLHADEFEAILDNRILLPPLDSSASLEQDQV